MKHRLLPCLLLIFVGYNSLAATVCAQSAAATAELQTMVDTGPAPAQRTLSADSFRDRLKGMWLGQLIGNYAGRQVEGLETVYWEGPIAVNKSITTYQVQWNSILQGRYYDSSGLLCGDPNRWLGDDDTCLEYLYAYALQDQATLTAADRTDLWRMNISPAVLYFANYEAWWLINSLGRTAAESGLVRNNARAGWTIDAQITTESLGAVAVGLRQCAAALAGDLGGITNEGFPVHAAQFYAAMYAEAPFAASVDTLVDRGLEVVPTASWARAIIEKARALYQADLADNGLLDGWLASRNAILAFAHQRGRYRIFVESASNLGLTTLAVLYGQGDFKATVEYGVRGGQDSDCNPATAGGLIGMMKGFGGISANLGAAGLSVSALPQIYDDADIVQGLPKTAWTIAEVVDVFQRAGETQILAGGGTITGAGADRLYLLPTAGTWGDAVITGDVSDPGGPAGLVREVQSAGGTVSVVVKRNGAILADNPGADWADQGRLIDGVWDLRSNGVLAFETYDGTTAARTDAYEVCFDRDVTISSLVLHEGTIGPYWWGSASSLFNPASPPYGGFFTSLNVEVLVGGSWVSVSGLALSEPLDPAAYFQSISLTFSPLTGRAVRISGPAGGSKPYTSLTEIEVLGSIGGTPDLRADFTGDGKVDGLDFLAWQSHFPTTSGATHAGGDANGDGRVDGLDFLIWQSGYRP